MKVKELIGYLQQFDEDYDVNVITTWEYDAGEYDVGGTDEHSVKGEVTANPYLKTVLLNATWGTIEHYIERYNEKYENKTYNLDFAYSDTDITEKQKNLLKIMRNFLPNDVYTINNLDTKEGARIFIRDHYEEFQKKYSEYVAKQKEKREKKHSLYYDMCDDESGTAVYEDDYCEIFPNDIVC